MNLEQRLSLARDLIARRDAIDAELNTLFNGGAPSRRQPRKCTVCGETGHRADACPQAQRETAEDTAIPSE